MCGCIHCLRKAFHCGSKISSVLLDYWITIFFLIIFFSTENDMFSPNFFIKKKKKKWKRYFPYSIGVVTKNVAKKEKEKHCYYNLGRTIVVCKTYESIKFLFIKINWKLYETQTYMCCTRLYRIYDFDSFWAKSCTTWNEN